MNPDAHTVLTAAHAIVSDAWHDETDSQRRRDLREVCDGLKHLAHQARPDRAVVFDCWAYGYVTVGYLGEPLETLAAPPTPGIIDARDIFLAGPTVQHTLTAADLVGHSAARPANALRGRLKRAADWIEQNTNCPHLAQALRAPSIQIAQDGTITRGRCCPVHLDAPL